MLDEQTRYDPFEEERRMDINIPETSIAKPLIEQPKELIINISSDGEYFIGEDHLVTDLYPHKGFCHLKAAVINAGGCDDTDLQSLSFCLFSRSLHGKERKRHR